VVPKRSDAQPKDKTRKKAAAQFRVIKLRGVTSVTTNGPATPTCWPNSNPSRRCETGERRGERLAGTRHQTRKRSACRPTCPASGLATTDRRKPAQRPPRNSASRNAGSATRKLWRRRPKAIADADESAWRTRRSPSYPPARRKVARRAASVGRRIASSKTSTKGNQDAGRRKPFPQLRGRVCTITPKKPPIARRRPRATRCRGRWRKRQRDRRARRVDAVGKKPLVKLLLRVSKTTPNAPPTARRRPRATRRRHSPRTATGGRAPQPPATDRRRCPRDTSPPCSDRCDP
jgi:hypothetical protein